ncbi:hypothetical protein BXZ70DRAFT_81159 [Cristinia sonorae]|uniref:Uncharacterized protein n=1 Tax=Cristinia sonorae TaxID=1940300 RepID=A0A8K0XR25_9AGAR|nr:hypothetical protein BXZ70DRAFT_81159 [Cristinia sonorae]
MPLHTSPFFQMIYKFFVLLATIALSCMLLDSSAGAGVQARKHLSGTTSSIVIQLLNAANSAELAAAESCADETAMILLSDLKRQLSESVAVTARFQKVITRQNAKMATTLRKLEEHMPGTLQRVAEGLKIDQQHRSRSSALASRDGMGKTMVRKILGKTNGVFVSLGVALGVDEQSLLGYAAVISGTVESAVVAAGDIITQNPEVLTLLLSNALFPFLSESRFLRPLLSTIGIIRGNAPQSAEMFTTVSELLQ